MANKSMSSFFSANISKKQASDTGMAAVLILLLSGFFTGNDQLYKLAIPVLVMNMTFPMFFFPFAIIWLGFSHLLGTVMSKVLLSIVFFLLLTPIGLVRKLLGKDELKQKAFKKSTKSVLVRRDQLFSSKHMEHPF